MIEATIKISEHNEAKIQTIKQQLINAIHRVADPDTTYIHFEHLNLGPLFTALENADPFMDEERLEFTTELLDELDIEIARIAFSKSNGWSYALTTDRGPEHIGSFDFWYNDEWISSFCDTKENSTLLKMLEHMPAIFAFLAFFGNSPEDALLEKFRSKQFVWEGLKGHVDCEMFFTKENINALWEEATRHYRDDASTQLSLTSNFV